MAIDLKHLSTYLLAILSLSFVACSKSSFYHDNRKNLERECVLLPSGQYDECMQGANRRYDDYDREREEYLKQVQEQIKEELRKKETDRVKCEQNEDDSDSPCL